MKKIERLELIKNLILTHEIETQHELLDRLKEEGLNPTQATISRDMNEIGIVKIPSKSGKSIYGLSKQNTGIIVPKPLVFSDILLAISRLEKMLNIVVEPGNSRLVKRHILAHYASDIFSLIADDDSLLLIANSEVAAIEIQEWIKKWE